ncbi:hypothetical protein [Streptomyces sp. NPDC046805]|uniref:hypothetical protein n=1 Tax=Streptomyces sp. NPDC046805 TaxID=3155134 RepID=UPI003402202D
MKIFSARDDSHASEPPDGWLVNDFQRHGLRPFGPRSERTATQSPRGEPNRSTTEGHDVHLIQNLTPTTVFPHEFERLPEGRRADLSASFDFAQEIRDLIAIGHDQGGFRQDVDADSISIALPVRQICLPNG